MPSGNGVSSFYRTMYAPQLINELGSVASAMRSNPAYKGEVPANAVIEAQVLDVRERLMLATEEAKCHDTNKIAARNALQQEAVQILDGVKRFLEFAAVTNPEVLRDTGFSQRPPTKRPGVLASPEPSVYHGPDPGSVTAKAAYVPGANACEVHVAQGDLNVEKNWRLQALFFDPEMYMNGFNIGGEYAFRFRWINQAGPGMWSLPVSLVIK